MTASVKGQHLALSNTITLPTIHIELQSLLSKISNELHSSISPMNYNHSSTSSNELQPIFNYLQWTTTTLQLAPMNYNHCSTISNEQQPLCNYLQWTTTTLQLSPITTTLQLSQISNNHSATISIELLLFQTQSSLDRCPYPHQPSTLPLCLSSAQFSIVPNGLPIERNHGGIFIVWFPVSFNIFFWLICR